MLLQDASERHTTRQKELCIEDAAEILRGNKVMRNIFIVCFVFPPHDNICRTTHLQHTGHSQLKITQNRYRSVTEFTPFRPISEQNYIAVLFRNGPRDIVRGKSSANVLGLAEMSNGDILLSIIVIPVRFLISPRSPIGDYHMQYDCHSEGSWRFDGVQMSSDNIPSGVPREHGYAFQRIRLNTSYEPIGGK